MDKLLTAIDSAITESNAVVDTFPDGSLSKKLAQFIQRNLRHTKKIVNRIIKVQQRAQGEIPLE